MDNRTAAPQLFSGSKPIFRLGTPTSSRLRQRSPVTARLFSPNALLEAGLTGREVEVLQWLMEGKRNSEIAIILGIGVRTAERHVQNIMDKLEAETRTTAAARAWEILSGR